MLPFTFAYNQYFFALNRNRYFRLFIDFIEISYVIYAQKDQDSLD